MAEHGSIVLRDVRKEYQIVKKAAPRLGGALLSKAFEYFRREPFGALNGLSLSIDKGEMVGFLGHNGAGKSTLLKLIAGITLPTSGTIQVNGRVTSLLELGVGFHPDLTGMENIFYNGAIMGMTRRQILDRLDSIIQFSGIADFLYEPVRHYSSGMYSRLACSVALHLEPEIILVDEILSVGDADFQGRALQKVQELHGRGVTVLLVSHDSSTMATLCPRIVWLDHGTVREDGPSAAVMAHYSKHMIAHAEMDGPYRHEFEPPQADARLIDAIRLEPGPIWGIGESFNVIVDLRRPAAPVRVHIRLARSTGEVLFQDVSPPCTVPGPVRYVVHQSPLCPVEGFVSVAITDQGTGALLDQRLDAHRFEVIASIPFHNFATRCDEPWEVEFSPHT